MRKYLSITVLMTVLFISCGKNGEGTGRIETSGTIEAVQVNVSAKTGGQVRRIMRREGAGTQQGDTLVIIDHEMQDLQLRQALAGLELARIQYQNDLRDDQRTAELFQQGSVTQKQRDDVNARSRVSGARLEQARAAVDIIRKNISDCYVTAPLAGVITNSNHESGETAGPGAVLQTISRLDTVELVVYVAENELGYVRLGQKAEVSIDSYRDSVFSGQVVHISSEAEFTPKNIQTRQDRVKQVFGVKLEIPNLRQRLKPGMPADAVILTKE